MSKKKVMGSLSVSINMECPNCEAYLDAFNEDNAGILNDEGQLWNLIDAGFESGREGWKNIGIEATCYKCKHEFLFDELEY